MKRIDPNYLLDNIPVRSDCPADIKYLVRWLKAMILYQDVDLYKDADKLIPFFEKWNNKSSPQSILFNLTISHEKVVELYERARDWLLYHERLE